MLICNAANTTSYYKATTQYLNKMAKVNHFSKPMLFLFSSQRSQRPLFKNIRFLEKKHQIAFKPELESRPKPSRPRRDIDVSRPRRDRDFEQKLQTRPRLERYETETRHETFETKRLQYFANIFDPKFWTFGELPNTLQCRFSWHFAIILRTS